jgi:hypothetical protein
LQGFYVQEKALFWERKFGKIQASGLQKIGPMSKIAKIAIANLLNRLKNINEAQLNMMFFLGLLTRWFKNGTHYVIVKVEDLLVQFTEDFRKTLEFQMLSTDSDKNSDRDIWS